MQINDKVTEYKIIKKNVPTFYFVGVTTGKSSIMKVFPLWMNVLRLPQVVIEGIDLKIHDEPKSYRNAVAQMKYDPFSLGALVTTHKIDLFNAAKDMFDYLDPYAHICGELSCISKREGSLEGHAKDPITAGKSLEAIIPEDYFASTRGEVLCFGAGGSGVATALHLINKTAKGDRPSRFVFTNRSQWRLDHARQMVESQKTDIQFEYICTSDPKLNDKVMASMKPYSVVINATGMGKDTPGSPITWQGIFPEHAIVWEFNYRGELDFLHQAEALAEKRHLKIEDGWVYFLHGWTQVVAQVLHIDLTPQLFDRLAEIARTIRK